MSTSTGWRLRTDRRALSVGLFVVLAFIYWACVRRYLPYDGDMMFRLTKSLVTAHSLRIQDPVLHLNEPYAFYGLAVSLLLMPYYLAGQLLFGDGTALITTFEPMVTALTVVALLTVLVELGVSWQRAFSVALLYAFGSLAWAYSGVLYSEPLVGLCTVASLLFLCRFQRDAKLRWLLGAGSAAALALLARWDSALLVVLPLTAYVGYTVLKLPTDAPRKGEGEGERGWRERFLLLVAYAAPIALVTAVNLGYDLFRYGRPLASPYLGTFQFSTPLPVGVFGLLFSPGAGLLVYVPVLLLGVFGTRALFQRWPRMTLLIAGLVAVRFAFYGQWFGWDGGITFGPRFLVPILPLLFVPIAFNPHPALPHRRRGKVRGIVLALSVMLGSLSIGVELLNQVVPYGQYYTSVAATLDAWARQQCGNCALWQIVQLTTTRLDYDWQYIPLHGQLAMLVSGRIDPIWSRIAVAVPLLIAPLTFIVYRLYGFARRLDLADRMADIEVAEALPRAG